MPSPSGTTVFTCPLSKCSWTYASPPDSAGELHALAAIFGKAAADESVIAAHLSTHELVEWVAEVVNLHDVMTSVAAELDEDGRIGHSLLTGAMATRANLAAVECIEKIGRAIKGDGGEDVDFADEWDDGDSNRYQDRVEAGLEPEDSDG